MKERPPIIDRISNRLVRHLPTGTIRIPDTKSVVSFTFDDVPVSAHTVGARIVSSFGKRATFYVSGSLTGQSHDGQPQITLDGLRSLAEDGHEIGCHTYSHTNVRSIGKAGLQEDIRRNDILFEKCLPNQHTQNFAYPYAISGLQARKELLKRFRTCRGGQAGINRGAIDRGYLRAIDIRSGLPAEQLTGWIDDLKRSPGWLIFFTHDVGSNPSRYGCYSHVLEKLISHAIASDFHVLSVNDALTELDLVKQIDPYLTLPGGGKTANRDNRPEGPA